MLDFFILPTKRKTIELMLKYKKYFPKLAIMCEWIGLVVNLGFFPLM